MTIILSLEGYIIKTMTATLLKIYEYIVRSLDFQYILPNHFWQVQFTSKIGSIYFENGNTYILQISCTYSPQSILWIYTARLSLACILEEINRVELGISVKEWKTYLQLFLDSCEFSYEYLEVIFGMHIDIDVLFHVPCGTKLYPTIIPQKDFQNQKHWSGWLVMPSLLWNTAFFT